MILGFLNTRRNRHYNNRLMLDQKITYAEEVIEKINLEAIQAEIGEVELKEMHDLISQL
jgi:hypothetical protein